MNSPFIYSPLTTKKIRQYFLLSLLPLIFYNIYVKGNLGFYLLVFVLGLLTSLVFIYMYTYFTNYTWKDLKEYIDPLTTILFFLLLYPKSFPCFAICFMMGIYILFSLLAFKYRLVKWSSFYLALSLSFLLFNHLGFSLNRLFISNGTSIFSVLSFYVLPCLIGFIFLILTKSIKWKISVIPIFTLLFISVMMFFFHSGSIFGRFYKMISSPILFYLCFLNNHKDTPVSGVGCLIYGMVLGMLLFVFNAQNSILRLSYIFVFYPITTPLFDYIGSSERPAIQKAIVPILLFLLVVIALVR